MRRKKFTCSCCGVRFLSTTGEQKQFDRDKGYGLCEKCAEEEHDYTLQNDLVPYPKITIMENQTIEGMLLEEDREVLRRIEAVKRSEPTPEQVLQDKHEREIESLSLDKKELEIRIKGAIAVLEGKTFADYDVD